MIAYLLDAVEVVLNTPSLEMPEATARALNDNGFTSLSMHYTLDNTLPMRTTIVGVGRKVPGRQIPGGVVQPLQAFAVFVPVLSELHRIAKAVAPGPPWRHYGAKPSHLPMLDALDSRGRWFVCYAPDDARIPEGIELAKRSRDLGRDQRV